MSNMDEMIAESGFWPPKKYDSALELTPVIGSTFENPLLFVSFPIVALVGYDSSCSGSGHSARYVDVVAHRRWPSLSNIAGTLMTFIAENT